MYARPTLRTTNEPFDGTFFQNLFYYKVHLFLDQELIYFCVFGKKIKCSERSFHIFKWGNNKFKYFLFEKIDKALKIINFCSMPLVLFFLIFIFENYNWFFWKYFCLSNIKLLFIQIFILNLFPSIHLVKITRHKLRMHF